MTRRGTPKRVWRGGVSLAAGLAALVPVGYLTDAHTVIGYTITRHLSAPEQPVECTPTSWIVAPTAHRGADFAISVHPEHCWMQTRGHGSVSDTDLAATFEALVAGGWDVIDADPDRRVLYVTSDQDESAVKGEAARLTGVPEYGAYQMWVIEYGDNSQADVV